MSNEPDEQNLESFFSAPLEPSITPNRNMDRKEVFRILVEFQDLGESVEVSRARVEAQFGIAHQELLGIEREGIAMNWPPL